MRVGPHAELFSCHRDVLTKSEYFKRALDGQFAEAGDQAIDLPEEDPTIFSFVVAFLYEGKFEPIKPIATVLSKFSNHSLKSFAQSFVGDVNKGKGKECNDDAESGTGDSDSGNSGSDDRSVSSCVPVFMDAPDIMVASEVKGDERLSGEGRRELGSRGKGKTEV